MLLISLDESIQEKSKKFIKLLYVIRFLCFAGQYFFAMTSSCMNQNVYQRSGYIEFFRNHAMRVSFNSI